MEVKNISSTSFQARIITPIKGRENIMGRVAKEFEKITKKVDGDLVIERYTVPCEKGIDPSTKKPYCSPERRYADLDYKGTGILASDLLPMLSKKSASHAYVKDIAKKLAAQFRMLVIEHTYNEKAEALFKEIDTVKASIKRAELAKKRAEKYGFEEMAEIYTKTIDGYKQKIPILEDKIRALHETLGKRMDRYTDKCIEPYHRDIFDEDFLNDTRLFK